MLFKGGCLGARLLSQAVRAGRRGAAMATCGGRPSVRAAAGSRRASVASLHGLGETCRALTIRHAASRSAGLPKADMQAASCSRGGKGFRRRPPPKADMQAASSALHVGIAPFATRAPSHRVRTAGGGGNLSTRLLAGTWQEPVRMPRCCAGPRPDRPRPIAAARRRAVLLPGCNFLTLFMADPLAEGGAISLHCVGSSRLSHTGNGQLVRNA